jgi:hypothetical protein
MTMQAEQAEREVLSFQAKAVQVPDLKSKTDNS